MRILILTTASFPEGIGDSVRITREATALAQAGHDVHVVSRSINGVVSNCLTHEVGLMGLPEAIPRLVRKNKIELILAHPQLYAWIALKRAPSVPVVADIHDPLEPRFSDRRVLGISWNSLTWRLMIEAERSVVKHAAAVVCTNPRVKAWLVAHGREPDNVGMVMNGVPDEYFHTRRERLYGHEPIAVFQGNMSRSMFDVQLLFRVIRRLLKQTRDLRFIFIGKGPLRNLMKKIEDLSPERILVEKWLRSSDVAGHVAACDIGLHPITRTWHGFYACHMKTFEYMGLGIPVVATNMDYSVQIAKRAGCCLLSNCGDETSFADNIVELAEDPHKLRELGSNGRKYSANLTWERTMQELVKFLESKFD